jgi:hypothetical protein
MEKLSYENILTNETLHQIDSTSLHLLFQRNFTLLNVIIYQDFLYGTCISLPDIHLDLVFINDVLICFYSLNLFKNTSPLFPMTTPMYLPEMVSYDIAVIAKLMLWDTMFDLGFLVLFLVTF